MRTGLDERAEHPDGAPGVPGGKYVNLLAICGVQLLRCTNKRSAEVFLTYICTSAVATCGGGQGLRAQRYKSELRWDVHGVCMRKMRTPLNISAGFQQGLV